MARTVVGLFDSYTEAQRVVQDLMDSGFRREDISVVANDRARDIDTTREVGDSSRAPEGAGAGAVLMEGVQKGLRIANVFPLGRGSPPLRERQVTPD
ncbi:MAG: hypothetical protein HC822_14810, partial [Oscillochloris sp.]|nr:hypothetical protein [Oscillochloris sp.]